MDDNVWEYPFGELDDDEDLFFHKPEITGARPQIPDGKCKRVHPHKAE